MRIWNLNLILSVVKNTGIFYKTPINLNYWWNFGILSFFFLIMQIVTGIFLAMFYNPSILLAFDSIMYINNEIYYGWWIRLLHANGASFFFFCVYIHIFRGLYYGSFLYPRQLLWISGMLLYVIMMVTAFLGYVLPWGQMSFWAAMVITSLLSAIPLIGPDFVFLLWGGFTIDDVSLHRFYTLHFLLPFVLLILSIFHILFLHEVGSSNPLGISNMYENVSFSPLYILKDLFSVIIVLFFFFFIIFVIPDYFGHTVNYQKANFLITPSHIVPEWYLLFFYAILRSIPGKLMGFFVMISSLLSLFLIPIILKNFKIRSSVFKPFFKFFFWIFFFDCILLSWIGGVPVIEPFLTIGYMLTWLYFIIIFIFFPFSIILENIIYDAYIWESKKNNKNEL